MVFLFMVAVSLCVSLSVARWVFSGRGCRCGR